MTTICPDYLVAGLERVFSEIQETRMRDVPILNPKLSVEVVEMQPWNGHCLCILITPWFMNLMLLPNEGDAWRDKEIGSVSEFCFPSGTYSFILADEPGIGRYMMCSLFSPMLEFEDHDMAVSVARASMSALMEGSAEDGGGRAETAAAGNADRQPALSERLQQPVSRRQLFRRALGGSRSNG